MVLCLETSSAICSVALVVESELIAIAESSHHNDHASTILSHLNDCLRQVNGSLSDIAAIAVSAGPGSFTGLRVGVSAAKGISFALGTPMINISTLEALVWTASEMSSGNKYTCGMIKARKDEVYAIIIDEHKKQILPATVCELYDGWHQKVLDGSEDVLFCGDGILRYQEICGQNGLNSLDIPTSARNLVDLAWQKHIKKDYSEAKSFTPSYLKQPHITQPRKVL